MASVQKQHAVLKDGWNDQRATDDFSNATLGDDYITPVLGTFGYYHAVVV